MTRKELYHLSRANGVPPLLYEWSFEELDNPFLDEILTPMLGENIDNFIRDRKCLY